VKVSVESRGEFGDGEDDGINSASKQRGDWRAFRLRDATNPPFKEISQSKLFIESCSKIMPDKEIETYVEAQHRFSTFRRLLTSFTARIYKVPFSQKSKTRYLPVWLQNFSVFVPFALFMTLKHQF